MPDSTDTIATAGPAAPPRDRRRRWRLLLAALTLAVLAVAALLLPLPSPAEMRSAAQSVGPRGVVLFVLVNALITVAPVPRTVFTLAAGLLFGPVAGIAAALGATMISAMLAFGLVRTLGRELVAPLLDRGMLRSIDERLRRRGWVAVASLRLIPVVPFSVLNYCSALSSIRWRHYLTGTVGVVPGTVAVVLLGDALTGTTPPALIAVSVLCAAIGVAGLLVDARTRLPALPPSPPPSARAR